MENESEKENTTSITFSIVLNIKISMTTGKNATEKGLFDDKYLVILLTSLPNVFVASQIAKSVEMPNRNRNVDSSLIQQYRVSIDVTSWRSDQH